MTHSNDTTRRGFLSTAAALAASATVAVPALAGATEADPIFAAIEAHKAAALAFKNILYLQGDLEGELPREKRRSRIAGEQSIVETDDPRWIEIERDVDRLNEAETDAAIVLVNIAPTTMAGVVALLQYANAADADGCGWPADLQEDVGQKIRSWHYFLIQMLAEVLPGLAASS